MGIGMGMGGKREGAGRKPFPPGMKKDQPINFLVDAAMLAEIDDRAWESRMSRAAWLRQVISEAIGKQPEKSNQVDA